MSAFVARAVRRDLVFVILVFLRSSGGSCNAPGPGSSQGQELERLLFSFGGS